MRRNGTGRGGSSASEPSPSSRRNAAEVTRNEGRPRPPKRGSSAISPRATSVSMTPLLSVGERLVLALDTVKGHNRRIFGKLQVQRRTEADARARSVLARWVSRQQHPEQH